MTKELKIGPGSKPTATKRAADIDISIARNTASGGSRASKRRLKDKRKKTATQSSSFQDGSGDDENANGDYSDASDDAYASSKRIRASGGHATSSAVRQEGKCPNSLRRPLLDEDPGYLYPDRSKDVLGHLLYPVSSDEFYSDYFKLHSVHISRPEDRGHFKLLPSRKGLINCFSEHALYLFKDIFIWKDGAQLEITDSPPASSDEEVIINSKQILNYLSRDHAVEIRTPQKYFDALWQYISLLEAEFDSAVSVSLLLAPAKTDGAAVFVDLDEGTPVDTFVVQLAGCSRWTLNPIGTNQSDAKASSIVEVSLDAGDTVYIRPGVTISCKTVASPEEPLFLLLKTNRASNLIDLTDLITQQAMMKVRQGSMDKFLPLGFLSFSGVAHSEDDEDPRRKAMHNAVRAQLATIAQEAVQIIDAASDQMAKQFMVSRLPVPLFPSEEALSYAGGGNEIKIFPYTKLKMLRPGIARAMVEDGQVVLYSCMENSRDPLDTVISPLEFELDDGPAIEALLTAYPEGVVVSELPHGSEELDDKLDVAKALFREGFLLVDDEASKPAKAGEGSQDEDDDDPF